MAYNRNSAPPASRTMFLLLLFSSLINHASASPVQQLGAHKVSTYSPFADLSSSSIAQAHDACLVGQRSVQQDAKALNQTLLWEIGTIRGSDGEQFCRTVMKMDYDHTWQYAVTDIDWRSHVSVEEPSQAAITLSFNFENINRITRYRWTIDPPKNDEWRQAIRINQANQQWSACGQNLALTFEWRIGFYVMQGRPGTAAGTLGNADGGGSPLSFRMGMQWRRC